MQAVGAIGGVEVGDTKQLDKGDNVGSQSQPLILPSEEQQEDDLSVPDLERRRKGTALDLIGEKASGASLDEDSSSGEAETSSKEEEE